MSDDKQQKAVDKAAAKATKDANKNAVDQVKAELERVKNSDLGKAEKKAATAHLKSVLAAIKSPLGG